jgi:hypothetical protein
VTAAAGYAFVLAAGLGRGASGHHSGLYIATSGVIALIGLGAAMVRGRRRRR